MEECKLPGRVRGGTRTPKRFTVLSALYMWMAFRDDDTISLLTLESAVLSNIVTSRSVQYHPGLTYIFNF